MRTFIENVGTGLKPVPTPVFFVRASPVGFVTGMHELQFAFSLPDIKAG
jgi:hypothetical protein